MDCQPKWRAWVDSARQALQTWVMPPLCLVCGGVGQNASRDLCRGCEQDLVLVGAVCARCAQHLPEAAGPNATCGACLRRPPRFQRSISPFRYAAPIDQLIRSFKYQGNTAAGRLLAQLFCQYTQSIVRPDCIVPVPLSQQRYGRRGFNQAIELATPIARHFGVPVRADVVARVRDTSEQAGLKLRQRRRNVRRAFAIVRPIAAKRVAILDDVMTSGSTVNELARVLRAAGVQEVEVWAVARAGGADAAQIGGARNK